MMSCRENISYFVPRDPSIKCWDDRVKLSGQVKYNLFQMGSDEFEETMGDNIKVYLRLKPSTSSDNPYTVLDSTSVQTEAPKDSVAYKNVTNGVGKLIHKFSFTSVLDQNTSQAALFKKCAVKNLKKFLSGENYLIMAYGTTSAGKTYTMQGDVENPGVIPRALDFVFGALKDRISSIGGFQPFQYNEFLPVCDDLMKKNISHKNFILSLDLSKYQRYPDSTITTQTMSSSGFSELYENITFKRMQSHLGDSSFQESFEVNLNSYKKCAVWISMIEIYNEQVYDLLEVPNEKGVRPKLTFRDDEYGNTFVKNLRYINVSSGHEAFQIFQFGKNNLHMAPTALNHRSSRSHCIFTITLVKFLDDEISPNAILSRFSFCDLAGMERAKKTLNVKDRLVESKAINTSLSILVKCLTTIKENQNSKEKKMIPYRESKLTKLFRDAVLGKEHFALIVNVTTESNLFDETLNVLKFSAIAQKIIPQNVFVKPKPVKAIKQSRFSRIVLNSNHNIKTIDWDASSFADSKINIKEEKTTSIEDLLDLIDKLKAELAQEKKRCETIESEIREDLTSQFSEMLKKQREANLSRLESETESLHLMYERREKRLVQYFEILGRQNKRKRPEEDEEYPNYTDKIKELEAEVNLLKSENGALRERVQSGKENINKLVAECSELKFMLAEKDRAISVMERTSKANVAGGEVLEKELRKQLDEAQAKITEYKSLLDEAAADYKEIEEQNKYLRNESQILEEDLAENREIVADLRNEISELQKLLSQKRINIEKLEEANDKITEELKQEKSKNVENTTNDQSIKELEILQEQLKVVSDELDQSKAELEALKEEKLDLEKDMELRVLKIADLESKVLNLEENIKNRNDEELEKKLLESEEEIERLKGYEFEAECLLKEKSALEKKCNDLNEEIKVLQKEMKDLIISNKKNFEKEKELENLTKTNEIIQKELLNTKRKNADTEEELKKQIEELKAKERELRVALESLQVKFEAAEYQNNVMKNLKEEAEKKTLELPELYEKMNKLEKEIENKEKDIVSLTQNKQQISNNYEKELSKLKDENERLRKDVLFANEVIAKTMTPLKTDKAEINRLKESVKKKDEEINKLKAEVDSIKNVDTDKENRSNRVPLSDKEDDFVLEQSSSRENSPFVNIKKKRNAKTDFSPNRLTKQIEALSIQPEVKSTRKKVDLLQETIHPSAIKERRTNRRRRNGKKDKELENASESENKSEKEDIPVKTKGKCHKQLFTENDFDGLTDLNASPLEPEIPRLRPRK